MVKTFYNAKGEVTGWSGDPKKEEKPWSHELDAVKHLTDVHMDFKKYVGTDFKLAKLDNDVMTKKQVFVMDMVPAARMAYDLCPNKEIGLEIHDMIMSHVNTMAIVNFNLDKNMIVDRVTAWVSKTQDDTTAEDDSRWKRMINRMTGKGRPSQEED